MANKYPVLIEFSSNRKRANRRSHRITAILSFCLPFLETIYCVILFNKLFEPKEISGSLCACDM